VTDTVTGQSTTDVAIVVVPRNRGAATIFWLLTVLQQFRDSGTVAQLLNGIGR
jgi:hypothetical protein